MMDNFELLYALFNQYIFTEAKNNFTNIKYYFDTNPSTMGNTLVSNMLEAIKDYELDAIGLPLFQSILMKSKRTEAEASKIISDIVRWKNYSKEQMLPTKSYLENICAKVELDKIGRMYANSPVDYIKAIKNLNFNTTDLDVFSTTSFDKVDINSIVAESGTGFITSSYDWINKTFDPLPGYEKGQMVIVCAAPGTGKSLFMMSEALFMAANGKSKVLYVGLGDNKMKDFIVRFGGMFLEVGLNEVKKDVNQAYEILKPVLQDRLEISINPAGKVSAEEIVEYVKARPEFDVIMVDYDSNLKGVGDSDNMYNSFGAAYETLTELTLMGKLVFVGSQTKVSSWSNEVINLPDVGESSRKQHSADMIIGIGKAINCPNHVHCFNISKNRRGQVDKKAYTIRLGNGKFYTISRELYANLKEETNEISYTPAQIAMMDSQTQLQTQGVNNTMNSIMAQRHAAQQAQQLAPRSMPSPFGK